MSQNWRANNLERAQANARRRWLERGEHVNKNLRETRRLNALSLIGNRGGECEICGHRYDGTNGAAFDWHHVDPETKHKDVAQVLYNLKRAEEEVEKCILVCVECHRKLHNGEY